MCIAGYFNVILITDEKIRGNPIVDKSLELNNSKNNRMNNYNISNIGFARPIFTWCSNKSTKKRIWKMLDRIFVNELWNQFFIISMVRHLVRIGSYHTKMLINY